MLRRLLRRCLRASPWIYHLHCGGCNGCDIEFAACLAPRFDIERFGFLLVTSPRHADILVVTGPVSKQYAPMVKRVYEQVPKPKVVVAIGACACSGGIWHEEDPENYAIVGSVDQLIPVDIYVPGCPPKPEAIINGLIKAALQLAEAR
ncbi:MAG: NADH-quinone oxidoreductase subunit NuoB [Candidatus Verstraetearchaeota archaeon]|nr:NADH-quinone oxidoreductase subunit NuoB [Candidatus Verstraetearchaeota archaeon]